MNTQPQTCLIRGGLIEVTKALSATSEQKHSSDFGRGKALFGDLAPCSPEAIDVTSLTCGKGTRRRRGTVPEPPAPAPSNSSVPPSPSGLPRPRPPPPAARRAPSLRRPPPARRRAGPVAGPGRAAVARTGAAPPGAPSGVVAAMLRAGDTPSRWPSSRRRLSRPNSSRGFGSGPASTASLRGPWIGRGGGALPAVPSLDEVWTSFYKLNLSYMRKNRYTY